MIRVHPRTLVIILLAWMAALGAWLGLLWIHILE